MLSSVANEYIYLNSTFGSNSGTLTLSGTLTGLSQILNDAGANVSIPAHTTKTWKTYNGATSTQTGDVTTTVECEVQSGGTWNANGNTITVKEVDVDGSGTLNLTNSTLDFSVTSDGDHLSIEGTANLLTGNTTITGHTGQQTPATLPEDGNFEVVGDVSDIKIMSDGDLTVIGSVTNCLLQTTEANIRQWHHTLDTQQLLDADSPGDDDLRRTKPALDNSHELKTG